MEKIILGDCIEEIKKIETPKKTGLSKCCNAKIIKGYCEKCCEKV